MDTYREAPLFPNYLHPSQEFMDEVVTQVATVAGFSGRARTVRALDRYSWPVQPAVAQALGLKRTPAPKISDKDFTLEQYLHISETLARLTNPSEMPTRSPSISKRRWFSLISRVAACACEVTRSIWDVLCDRAAPLSRECDFRPTVSHGRPSKQSTLGRDMASENRRTT